MGILSFSVGLVFVLLAGCSWPNNRDGLPPNFANRNAGESETEAVEACSAGLGKAGDQCLSGMIFVGKIENKNLFTTPPMACADLSDKQCLGEVDQLEYTYGNATEFCEDLSFAGFDDWSLPEQTELALMACKSEMPNYYEGYPQLDPGCKIFGGKTESLKGFANDSYWSKTASSKRNVYLTEFDTGYQFNAATWGWSSFRCVRSTSL